MTSVLIAGAFAALAWRMGWLTRDGAIAAALVGAAILAFGGLWGALALVTFFASGTGLTLIGRDRKTQPEHAGRGRDAMQVLCTGGVAAVAMLIYGIAGRVGSSAVGSGGVGWNGGGLSGAVWLAAFLGSLAAAAADTWATEIGMLSRVPPRSIITRARVAPGTSGGITLLGSTAGCCGSAVIAALALLAPGDLAPRFAPVLIAGILGMGLDSVLGATAQAIYRDPSGQIHERARQGFALVRGLRWMTNPVVNLLATLAGAIIAGGLTLLW